jgi:hypothetical protein
MADRDRPTTPQKVDTKEDTVLRELKKLRERRGLTIGKMSASPSLLSALATSDPAEAVDRLVQMLNQLEDTEKATALRVDLGIHLAEVFDRSPRDQEESQLGERRQAYASLVGRDIKTIERWSNASLKELRQLLLNDTFTGHLFVAAAVQGEHIVGCTLIRQDSVDSPITERTSLDYRNPSAEPSLPCLIYAFPRDWHPGRLTLIVTFDDPSRPGEVWGGMAGSFFDLVYGTDRHELNVRDGVATCTFVNPRRDQLYAIWWR